MNRLLKKSAVFVGLSAQQTIAKSDPAVVEFDDVDFDVKDEFDTTSHEFAASETGTHHVDVYITVASLGARSDLVLRLEKITGTTSETVAYPEVGTKNQVTMISSRLLQLGGEEALKARFTNGNTTEDRALVDFENASMFSVYQVS